MNLLMIMGFLGLFSLTLSATPVIEGVDDPSASEQRSLQEQIFQMEKYLVKLHERQQILYGEQTNYNCRLGRLESKSDDKPVFIDGPGGLYFRQDGELHLVEKKSPDKTIEDIVNNKPVEESSEASDARFPDDSKTKESDIFLDPPQTIAGNQAAANEADRKANEAKGMIVDLTNEGNKKVYGHQCKPDDPSCSEVLPIECKSSEDTSCKARLDNHKPMPQDNLKEYSEINDYYSDTKEQEADRVIKGLALQKGFEL